MKDAEEKIGAKAVQRKDAKAKRETEPGTIMLDRNPKGTWKVLAGADHDEWNNRQATLVIEALPSKRNKDAATAVLSGIVDMKPADPIEGMLIGQIIATHEAAMNLYRLGCSTPWNISRRELNFCSLPTRRRERWRC